MHSAVNTKRNKERDRMIQVKNLTKRFGTREAISNLTFSIAEGEIVGFLGPNGAGKSTTMNSITGCIEATEGTVTINDLDTREHPEEVRRLIGYLPEIPPLYTDMTVEEYLDFVYYLKKCTLDKDVHLATVISRAGLEDVTGRLIRNLSKGYRQRVGLAQALIGDPKVLILDEPTVGLDPKQIIEIRDVIRTLGKDHTVILSSHILPEVQEVCDRVIVIHQGVIVADGTTAELSEKMTGSSQLEMMIEGESSHILDVLCAIPGVENATIHDADGSKSVYRITAEPNTDIRHNVFEVLSQNQLPILSMNQIEASLEDIFLKLTDSDAPVPESPAEQYSAAAESGSDEKPKKKRRLFGRRKGEK